ncbi:MAG: DUF4142 domain-containing protein [Alphaproteobacteria bacterium]
MTYENNSSENTPHNRVPFQSVSELPPKPNRPMETFGPLVFVALVVAAFAFVMWAADAQASRSSQSFVQKATIGNLFEIQSSQLALEKSQDPKVRDFAQQMVSDHAKVSEDMKALLASGSINVTAPDQALDRKHQKILDKLNAASGTDFDAQYVKAQNNAHDDAISLFRGYSKQGDNDTLKDFAKEKLPTLEQHKEEAKKLKSTI